MKGMPQEGGQGHKYYEEHRVLDPKKPEDAKKATAIEAKSSKYYNDVRAAGAGGG